MEKIIFAIAAFLTSFLVAAQEFQGIAVYESKTTFKELSEKGSTDMDPEIEKMLKEQLAKAMEKRYILKFDKACSLYEEEEKLAKPDPGGAVTVSVYFSGMGGKHYKNLKDKTYLAESDMFGKEFLIADKLEKKDWQLINESKKIGNYTCYKAICVLKNEDEEEDSKTGLFRKKDLTLTAWYTPEIPVGHGPGQYWGLPGLVLEATDGHTMILCSKITLNPKEKFSIKPPTKGQKVTQAEFDAIMKKKSEEMEIMNSGDTSPGAKRTILRIGG